MLYAIVLFVVLSSITGVLYVCNKKTNVPEGCENIKMNCEGCKIISCINHPSKGE